MASRKMSEAIQELRDLTEGDWGKLDDPNYKAPARKGPTPGEVRAQAHTKATQDRAAKVIGAALVKKILDKGFFITDAGHSPKMRFHTRPRVAKALGLKDAQIEKLFKANVRVMPRKKDPKFNWYMGD